MQIKPRTPIALVAIGMTALLFCAALQAQILSETPVAAVPTTDGNVLALAEYNGTVYIGGSFTSLTFNGQTYMRNNLAAIDAVTGALLPWNPAAPGRVSSLAVKDGILFVGGGFDSVATQSRRNIASFDLSGTDPVLTGWAPQIHYDGIGTHFGAAAGSVVQTLEVSGNYLYVGGAFVWVDSTPRGNICAFDATNATNPVVDPDWSPNLRSDLPAPAWEAASATDILVSGSIVYVSGGIQRVGGFHAIDGSDTGNTYHDLAAEGLSKALMGFELPGTGRTGELTAPVPNTITTAGTGLRVEAMGSSIFMGSIGVVNAYDASTWSLVLEPPADDRLFEVAVVESRSLIFFGGEFLNFANSPQPGIAIMDSVTFAYLTWNPNFYSNTNALRLDRIWSVGERVYVAGYFDQVGGQDRPGFVAFDYETPAELIVTETTANGPVVADQAIPANGRDFGDVDLGSQSSPLNVVLSNAGSVDLTLTTAPTLTSGDILDYALDFTQSLPLTISGGSSASFTLTFAPTSVGLSNATVSFTYDANGSSAQFQFQIGGNGLDPVLPTPPAISTTALNGGIEGQTYSDTLAATGGTTPYSWSMTTGMGWLSINSVSGELTGTPLTSDTGVQNVAVTVTDANSLSATKTLTLTVAAIPTSPVISTAVLSDAMEGQPYGYTLAAIGGTGPYTWSMTTVMSWLSINPLSGEIAGTPLTSDVGVQNAAVTVTDFNGLTASKTLTLTVAAIPASVVISTTALNGATEGQPYGYTVVAIGGTTPYTWSLSGGMSWLSINPLSGELTGTPLTSDVGVQNAIVTVTDFNSVSASKTLSLTVSGASGTPLAILTTSLPAVTEDSNYQLSLAAGGGSAPYIWSAGGLPEWLVLDQTTGALAGFVPSGAVGGYNISLTVTDASSDSTSVNVTLDVSQNPGGDPGSTDTSGAEAGGLIGCSLNPTTGSSGAIWAALLAFLLTVSSVLRRRRIAA